MKGQIWKNRSVVAPFTSHPEGQSSVSWRRGPEAQVQEQSRSQVSISSSLEEGRRHRVKDTYIPGVENVPVLEGRP